MRNFVQKEGIFLKKSEKKRDMLLIGGLLLAAFLALGLKFLLRQEGAALVVRVNGSEVAYFANDNLYVTGVYTGSVTLPGWSIDSGNGLLFRYTGGTV